MVDPDHIYMRNLNSLMEERDVIAMRNKMQSASDNSPPNLNTPGGATLAGAVTPGATGLTPGRDRQNLI